MLVSSPDWPAIQAGLEPNLLIQVLRGEAIFDFKTNTFHSHIKGTLNIAEFSGMYSGKVSGSYLSPADPLGTMMESSADLTWRIKGQGITATGSASADFTGQFDDEYHCETAPLS